MSKRNRRRRRRRRKMPYKERSCIKQPVFIASPKAEEPNNLVPALLCGNFSPDVRICCFFRQDSGLLGHESPYLPC